MSDVSGHYTVGGLGSRILAALEATGVDPDALTPDDLAPVDAFHIRGRDATEELLDWTGVDGGAEVLDVGSGIGGTARLLASRTGCRVQGVDLTDEYCRVATMLSDRVGLGDRTSFRQGSALDLPFADDSFDVVWTEHVQMNVEDKPRFYGEIARVLRPGGRFAFHDLLAGGASPPHFPVPWAAEPAISHLIAPHDLRDLLAGLGFAEVRWADTTAPTTGFFETVVSGIREEGWAPLGLQLLMGDNADEKFGNVLRNLKEDRIRVVQAVMTSGEG